MEKPDEAGSMGAADRNALRLTASVAVAVLLVGLGGATARAQVGVGGTVSGPSPGGAHNPPALLLVPRTLNLRGAAEHSLALGEWLISPTAYAGGIYDSNPEQSVVRARSAAGFQVTLDGLAERNTGIDKTDVYGMADSRIYNRGNSSDTLIDRADLGATETYSPVPEWTFTGQGEFSRQRDLFSNLGVNQTVTTLNTTGNGLLPTNSPAAYNQLAANAAAENRFGDGFADIGISVASQLYDNVATASGSASGSSGSNNNTVYSGTGRGGVWMTPDIYGFVEGSLDSRQFGQSALGSNGYRITAGVGTGLLGLMKGEIYVGYQAESYNSAAIGTAKGPAFGGQLDYSPLPELDLKVGADRTIGTTLGSIGTANGTKLAGATQVTDVVALATYSIAPEWSAAGRAGYIHSDFIGTNATEDAWTIGPTLTYSVWQNVAMTLDYQHTRLTSNLPLTAFFRDVVTVGVSYRY
jgi:hypothetical protein